MQGKMLFPFNLGAGNRGCEGIIRGTMKILDVKTNVLLLNKNLQEKELDHMFNIDKYGQIYVSDDYEDISKINIIMHKFKRKILKKDEWFDIYPYLKFVNKAIKDDVVMFTGGDLYCYKKMSEVNAKLVSYLTRKNIRSVLWGCSISPDFMNEEIIRALKQYKLITCREHLSIEVLKENNIVDNVRYFPDPAFALEPEMVELPDCFEKDVIGINISNFVGGEYTLDNDMGKNIENCIKHLLNETDYNILIIPHVSWERQDDRIISRLLCDKFNQNKRVTMLNMEEYNYCQIRYIISKCRFFMGARTHSVISGYSTCVPTIALGYSIKSKGIAKDLGLPNELVVDCKNLKDDNVIQRSIMYLMENEKQIINHLKEVMPSYKKDAFNAKEVFEEVLYK